MRKDRRRYPRVGLELEGSLEASGIRWRGKTVALSPYGAKVALPPHPVTLPPGRSVEARLALPEEDSPLSLMAQVLRVDPDGIALDFPNQGAPPFERLKDLVDSLLHTPLGNGRSAPPGGARRPPPDFGQGPRLATEPQSVAFLFIELRPEQRERLQALVDSLRGARPAPPAASEVPVT